MSGWRRICCAVDFSEASRHAVEEAAALAARTGGELALVHVVAGSPAREARLPYRSEVSPLAPADAARRLEEWRAAAEPVARGLVSASLRGGGVVDEILRFVREGRHDVLVIGTPGARGCDRIVFGSAADALIRRAPCCVVVARPLVASA
jgi:nucleotide-binding universal stress UspA family protein